MRKTQTSIIDGIMLATIAIILLFILAIGLAAIRSRKTSERRRRYLATIQLWQPGDSMGGAVPLAQAHTGTRKSSTHAVVD